MALDDQLAALAAGELDDDTARALRARAAADPALARQLARHEQLQRLLVDWEAPGMSDDGARRLESRIDEALAALGDEPLAERTPPAAAPATPSAADEPVRRGADQPGVVDLAGARRRRDDATSRGGAITWPSWGAGAAVAAVLAAIVGTGIVLGGLPGGAGLDMLAGDDSAEDSPEVAQLESDDSVPTDDADEEAADEDAAGDTGLTSEERTRLDPEQQERVEVAEGDLLALVELADRAEEQESASGDGDAATTDGEADESGTDEGADTSADSTATGPSQQCVEEALQRDTAQADDRRVELLVDGTYAGQDAAFVVVRTAQPSGEDRYEVLAYDPGDCSLLARDATSR